MVMKAERVEVSSADAVLCGKSSVAQTRVTLLCSVALDTLFITVFPTSPHRAQHDNVRARQSDADEGGHKAATTFSDISSPPESTCVPFVFHVRAHPKFLEFFKLTYGLIRLT